MADLEQWVNLDKDAKWVEDEITSIERVGKLNFEITTNKAKFASFRIRIDNASADNARYSVAERGRNINFTIQHGRGSETNLGSRKIRVQRDISVPAAGGNRYRIRLRFKRKGEADYHQIQSTKYIVTRRKLLYYVVTMDSSTLPAAEAMADPTPLLTTLETDYWDPAKNYYIKLKKKAAVQMPLIKNLLLDEFDETGADIGNAWGATNTQLTNAVKAALAPHRATLQARKPFCFVSVWCNYLASKGKKVIDQVVQDASGNNVTMTLPSWFGGLFSAPPTAPSLEIDVGAYLWYGLNDADDAAQNWLESVQLDFVDSSTGAATRIAIPNNRVEITGAKAKPFGAYRRIKIDLTPADMQGIRRRVMNQISGTFRLQVKVRTAASWTNGFAMGGKNVIVVADKVVWEQRDNAGKAQTLNHEFGHKVGMTAQGGQVAFGGGATPNDPDAPATLYGNIHLGPTDNSHGHQGNHCQDGVTWTNGAYNPVTRRFAGSWSLNAGATQANCVMFGSNGFWSGATLVARNSRYCTTCEPIVRKLDLGSGMPGFASCVTD